MTPRSIAGLTHPAPSNKLKTLHIEPNYGR